MSDLTPHQRLTALYTLAGYGRQSAKFATDLLAEHDAELAAGKDTRKGAATLSSDVLDLLGAVADLIDVPFPSGDADTERAYYRLLERRAWSAISVIRTLAERSGTYPEWVAGHLADAAKRNPVTYPVHVAAEPPAAAEVPQ